MLDSVNLYGAAVDEILAVDDGSDVQWSLADHEASVRDIVDDTGTLAERRNGDAASFSPSATPPVTATTLSAAKPTRLTP